MEDANKKQSKKVESNQAQTNKVEAASRRLKPQSVQTSHAATRSAADSPIRFAVVGLGLMGKRHCEVLSARTDATLTGVFDHHPTHAAELKLLYPHITTFTSYDELLKSRSTDAVVLCLPSTLHAEYGILAARAGLHVVVEKPIDADSTAAAALIAECDKAGVQCAVISQNRFSDGLFVLAEAVHSGLMGTPVLARASVKWFRHDAYYTDSDWRGKIYGERGGVLMNQAIHSVDILQWLFGLPIEVQGFVHASRPGVMETEDTAVAILRFKNGLLATLEASTSAAPGFHESYEVQSPIASCFVEKGQVVQWHHQANLPLPLPHFSKAPLSLNEKLNLFHRQYENIAAAIRKQFALVVPSKQALAVVQTIEAIYRAAKPK